MFLLLLKTEYVKRGLGYASLDYVGVFSSKSAAARHVDSTHGELHEDQGFGNKRMLESDHVGSAPIKTVWKTDELVAKNSVRSSFILAEY